MSGERGRVCVLTSVHHPFDTRVFYREAFAARDAGFEVLLIAPGAEEGVVDGIRMTGLPTVLGRAGRPLRWPVLMWKAVRSGGDIYHFHDPELLPWGLLLRWVTRKPVVYDSHEYLREDILTKHWIPGPIRGAVARVAAGLERFVAKRLSAVVVVTEEMGQGFEGIAKRVVLVRNLPPAPGGEVVEERRAPVVIYSGLMNVERGLSILLQTGRVLKGLRPEAEIHVLGPVEWFGMPAEVAGMSEAEWEAAGVKFLGTVPQPQVAPILARATAGWLPRDPKVRNNLLAWPHKLVEYMVVGLPVIASDLPTQAQVVRDADCGIVVSPPLSAEAHAEAMAELLGDPGRARLLGESGRRAALAEYSWEAESLKLQSLYKDLTPREGRLH